MYLTHAWFGSHRSTSIRTIAEYHARVAVPYIDTLLENINQRFSEDALSVITRAGAKYIGTCT